MTFVFCIPKLSAQTANATKSSDSFQSGDVKHNPWELIIYRPENSSNLNEIRCWLKIEDEEGNDVLGTKATATYEWVSIPNVINY